MDCKHWKVTIKEVGNEKPIVTTYHGTIDLQGVVDFYGLKESDVEWYKIEVEKETTVCCICGLEFYGMGNNPYPVVDDENARCCDVCNSKYVVPARLHAFFEHQKAKDNEKV